MKKLKRLFQRDKKIEIANPFTYINAEMEILHQVSKSGVATKVNPLKTNEIKNEPFYDSNGEIKKQLWYKSIKSLRLQKNCSRFADHTGC